MDDRGPAAGRPPRPGAARVLDAETPDELAAEAARLGLEAPGPAAERVGGRMLPVILPPVAPELRARLREALGSVGGAAVLPRGAGPGPVLLLGSPSAYRDLLAREGGVGPEATALLRAADSAMAAYGSRERRTVHGAHSSFAVGGRTLVMGVVNVTPDSFSDGGRFLDPGVAAARAIALAEEGADLLDLGGESTRPGAAEVSPDAEWARVGPVLRAVRPATDRPISIDTRHPEVARRAIAEGADIVNDVTGLADPEMRRLVASTGAAAVVMHLRGTPSTMASRAVYADLRGEVFGELAEAVARAEEDGVRRDRILIDPGLGFAKTAPQSLELLAHVGELRSLGCPIVVGASRKSFLGALLGGAPVEGRLEASLAAAVLASLRGAEVVRVHDVGPTVRALAVADAVRSSRSPGSG